MARKKNIIPAAAAASSSTMEGRLQLLKDLNIRLVAETVELRKQVKLLNRGTLVSTESGRGAVDDIKRDGRPAEICATDPRMEEAYMYAEKSAEAEEAAAPVKKAVAGETSELQEGNVDCTVAPLLPDLDERFVRMEERLVNLEEEGEMRERRFTRLEEEAERRERMLFSAMEERLRRLEEAGRLLFFVMKAGFGKLEEKEAYRRKTMLMKLEEERERREKLLFSAIEERLKNLVEEEDGRREIRLMKLEEEGERRDILLYSAMEEMFRKFEEEDERRETRLMKLEEEGERRDILFCSAVEEVVLLKKNGVQEEKSSVAVDLAAKKKNRGWIKWISAAICVVVGVAVVTKSSNMMMLCEMV